MNYSPQELFDIQKRVVYSPILTNRQESFKFKIPEIVLQQPDDWHFYMSVDEIYSISMSEKYKELKNTSHNIYKDDYDYLYMHNSLCGKKVQYLMYRFRVTIPVEKEDDVDIKKLNEKFDTQMKKVDEKMDSITEQLKMLTEQLKKNVI